MMEAKILEVKETIGINKPFLHNSKAFKRNNTSTIEIDSYELTRLVLEGKNMNYEELPSDQQEMTFNYLERKLKDLINIDTFNQDTLKILNLYNKNTGYNNAAYILSDNNSLISVDITKFGENINIIQKRLILNNMSILEIYDLTMEVFRDYYQYEKIEGSYRKKVELIPEKAFSKLIAITLIYRKWNVNDQIRISMFDDRILISSPGLMDGISEEEYLSGRISMLRNPIISNVFYRLGIVEIFGTGIRRIIQSYENSIKKPLFNVSDNTIQITLPVINSNYKLDKDEKLIYDMLSKIIYKSMNDKGIVHIKGKGRGTKYKI